MHARNYFLTHLPDYCDNKHIHSVEQALRIMNNSPKIMDTQKFNQIKNPPAHLYDDKIGIVSADHGNSPIDLRLLRR